MKRTARGDDEREKSPAPEQLTARVVVRVDDAIVILADDEGTTITELLAATGVRAVGRPLIVLRCTVAATEMVWAPLLKEEPPSASAPPAAASPELSLVTHDGRIRLDVARRAAVVAGESVELTRLEFDLLACLMSAPGQTLSRRVLLERVWGFTSGGTETITVHIRQLRAKIEPVPRRPRHIHTIRGVGYRFEP